MLRKVYFYSAYERLWHWIQAAAVIGLIISGFEISYADHFSVAGFRAAVYFHTIVGALLAVNAFLALFYNIASGLLKRYIPKLEDFFSLGFKHAGYYLSGIFRGEPHPFDKTPEKRLLPLQKVTYFMILNVLLPLMVITGVLKASASINPSFVDMFGGLSLLGPIHRFGAWLLTAFVIIHVYFITTGRTPLSNLISMITGYDYIEDEEERQA